jgi:hypothetical protein
MSDDELYKKLSAELDVIRDEVVSLRVKQHMFWELQKIVGANPNINVANEFYDWIEEIYATSMSVAIRRQTDRTKNTVSFWRFLEQVERRPSVVTRNRYSTLFINSSVNVINADFDSLVGPGRDQIDALEVKRDRDALEGKCDVLEGYANTWVAHRANGAVHVLTSLRDIDEAIEGVEVLLKKYLHLFRSEIVLDSLLPTLIGNWKAIFRVPWIAPPSH